jgi:plasmid maintenance system antidote protein VapI
MKRKICNNRIREILEEKQMTQQELADMVINGNRAHISRIVNNKLKNITLPMAFRIAEALGKKVDEVFIYELDHEA